MDSLEKKIDDLNREKSKSHEKIYERLNDLEKASAVSSEQYKNVMCALDRQEEMLEKLERKLNELIAKPARRWDGVISSGIAATIGLLVGYVFLRLGFK